MKTKIFVLMMLLGVSHLSVGCGSVRTIGKMYVVDEHGKPVENAIVWNVFSSDDSILVYRRNNKWDMSRMDSLDPYAYRFRNTSIRRIGNANAGMVLRIQAKGYADVVIRALGFARKTSIGYSCLPVLYVKMYPRKYMMKGDVMTLMQEYTCTMESNVTDTSVVEFMDYMQAARNENVVQEAARNLSYIVRTFPNPVIDKLEININAAVTQPYKAVLADMQGRTIREMEISSQREFMDMQWETKGIYLIQVYNPEGALLYALKFLKS